jgi:hypothetical protein
VKELLLRLEDNDTSEFAEVYRKLKRYVFLRKKLIEKISRQQILENSVEGADQIEDKLLRIEKKFEGVNELQEKFNERIFSVISRTYSLATERPIDLVRVMRIVKNEEVANKAAEKSTKDNDSQRQSIVIQSDDDDEPSALNLIGSIFPEPRVNEKTK